MKLSRGSRVPRVMLFFHYCPETRCQRVTAVINLSGWDSGKGKKTGRRPAGRNQVALCGFHRTKFHSSTWRETRCGPAFSARSCLASRTEEQEEEDRSNTGSSAVHWCCASSWGTIFWLTHYEYFNNRISGRLIIFKVSFFKQNVNSKKRWISKMSPLSLLDFSQNWRVEEVQLIRAVFGFALQQNVEIFHPINELVDFFICLSMI